MPAYDAILIPGGGLLSGGRLPPWVENRLDRALRIQDSRFYLTMSRGTVHRAPPADEHGFPVDESVAAARYLLDRGMPQDRILVETTSYDTIGNAYFARVVHLDQMALRRLLVITSEFHLERTRVIFEWIYGLSANDYELAFESVPNVGIAPESLAARIQKEKLALQNLRDQVKTIKTMKQLHEWLFREHNAYRLGRAQADVGHAISTY